jgi:hypothetical protein
MRTPDHRSMFKPYDDSALGVECAWPMPSIAALRDAAGSTVSALARVAVIPETFADASIALDFPQA